MSAMVDSLSAAAALSGFAEASTSYYKNPTALNLASLSAAGASLAQASQQLAVDLPGVAGVLGLKAAAASWATAFANLQSLNAANASYNGGSSSICSRRLWKSPTRRWRKGDPLFGSACQ